MAKDKNRFLLSSNLIHTVEKLSDQKAGLLLKTILRYVNDQNPIVKDITVDLVFEPIKQQLKADLKKWIEETGTKSTNGVIGNLKRWSPDLYEKYIKNDITLDEAVKIAESRKVSQPDISESPPIAKIADIVYVNEGGIVNDNVNEGEEKKGDIPENGNLPIVKNENFLKFEQWILDNAPTVAKMKEPFTESQFIKLGKDFTRAEIIETVQAMHNKMNLLKAYKSANLTTRSWINLKRQKNQQNGKSNNLTGLTKQQIANNVDNAIMEKLRNGTVANE